MESALWEGQFSIIQGAAERTPRFRLGVARGRVGIEQYGCVVRQLCLCRSQFTPWLGRVSIAIRQ
jgi:hypothetical protein